MSKTPLRRDGNQTVEEMTEQLSKSKEGNRLYKSGNYKEVSDALKAEALQNSINNQMNLLHRVKDNGRVDLNDLDAVSAAADRYMTACKSAGTYPTMLGFCASMGWSRKEVYRICRTRSNAVTDYIDALRSSWAAIIADMSLSRQCSEPVAIFLLKNCDQGLTDKQEVELTATSGRRFENPDVNDRYIPYLRAQGINTDEMSEAEIKEAYFQKYYCESGLLDKIIVNDE